MFVLGFIFCFSVCFCAFDYCLFSCLSASACLKNLSLKWPAIFEQVSKIGAFCSVEDIIV